MSIKFSRSKFLHFKDVRCARRNGRPNFRASIGRLITDTLQLFVNVGSHDHGQPARFSGKWPGPDNDDAHTRKVPVKLDCWMWAVLNNRFITS